MFSLCCLFGFVVVGLWWEMFWCVGLVLVGSLV